MDLLGDPLIIRPIQTGWKFTIEPYRSCRIGFIDNPDHHFGNGSVWTGTWNESHGTELLLTLVLRPPSCFSERMTKWRCFRVEWWMQLLEENVAMMKYVEPTLLSSEWRKSCDQKSRPLMTRPSHVQCQQGSYRITLVGVSRDMPTSQTMSIILNILVLSMMQNTVSTTQGWFRWRFFNAMSRQFIWFVALGQQAGERICHQGMIQCFSQWGQVWIASLGQLLDKFLCGWSVFWFSWMLNWVLQAILPRFRRLE